MDDIEAILYQIGLLGKGSDCLMEIGGYSENDEFASPFLGIRSREKCTRRRKSESNIRKEIALP